MIHRLFRSNRFNKLRDLSDLLKRVTLFCVPVQVLITEMIDSQYLIPGTKCRFNHMAGGKSGNNNPFFHLSKPLAVFSWNNSHLGIRILAVELRALGQMIQKESQA